jgi:ferredoxin
MKQKYLKTIRVIVSLLFLIALSAIFLDFRELIPTKWVHRIHSLQFIPSILNFIHILSLTAAGFIFVIILTFLYGRVYCSTICPLGILQDVFSYISKKLKIKIRFRFTPPHNIFRYGFLVLSVVSLFFGSLLTLYLLDPYSNFGRIFSDLVRPLVIKLNNLMARNFEKIDVYFLYRVQFLGFQWRKVIFPLFVTVVILWFSLKYGRLYCNTVCPVGTFLGLLSRVSLFRIKMDQSSCTQCGKCALVCKASCIDTKNMKVDISRCVSCYNCIKACSSFSIGYKISFDKKPVIQATSASKREFVSKTFLYMLAFAGLSKKVLAREAVTGEPVKINKKYPVSPPGSVSISHFNNFCTACHLCVSLCPSKVLQPSFLEYGFKGMLQPHMDYSLSFCEYECTRCGEVCPTGAILPLTVEDKKLTQTGRVHFIMHNCIVYTDETSCGSCSEHCPTQAVHMIPYKDGLTIPETETSTCIGCGACEYACPAKPIKAIYVDGLPIHKVARKPHFKEIEETKTEEFPF